jgi:hypothetical protein
MMGGHPIPNADSGTMRGYWGILNAQGQFWSHSVHSSQAAARDYIKNFWGPAQRDVAEDCLRTFRIIEVRVRLEPLPASAMSASGQDRATGLEAKPASAVAATSGETPNPSENPHD